MKKKSLLFVCGFVVLSLSSFSQIKVNSSGYVGINQNYAAYNLDWFGTGRFWTTWGQLIFDSSGYGSAATIYPADDWVGALGKSDKRFNSIYCYTLYYDNLVDWSDERLKENIKPLEGSLDKIRLLNGVSYKMKRDFYKMSDERALSKAMSNSKDDFGLLAQEVMEVIPEIVELDSTSNLYSVNYVKLIPVLVEAIKEQQIQIQKLTELINKN